MPKVTIDPKHARLQAFLAGKGIVNTQEKQTLEISDLELRSMLRKAEQHGYVDLIKYSKTDLKKADKAAEEAAEGGTQEPKDEKPSKETTADQELEELEDDEPAKPRRRRVP